MPGRHVFPGGAVDEADGEVPMSGALRTVCSSRLSGGQHPANAYAAAAVRELWEETGLKYARPGSFEAPDGWEPFAAEQLVPNLDGMTLVFRATTPPGRARRFDARFFLADAKGLAGHDDDFSGASGELSDLVWQPIAKLDELNLAAVTQAALRAALVQLPAMEPPEILVHRHGEPLAGGQQDPSE